MSDETEAEMQARLESKALAGRLAAEEHQKAETELLVSEAQQDMLRKLAAKEAISALEAERTRRVAEATLAQTQEQMLRQVNIQKAISLEEEEKERRAREFEAAAGGGLEERKQIGEQVDVLAEGERTRRLSTAGEFTLANEKRQIEASLVQKVADRRASLTNTGSTFKTSEAGSGSYSYGTGAPSTAAQIPRSEAQPDNSNNSSASGIAALAQKAVSAITGRQ
ncbi:hypothetical protein DFJ77DRAFT_454154 [Powellomyces hirtus]|nr:hypothetical protein DFJ77DRAFT_454154 [Powellomyces hirtus]